MAPHARCRRWLTKGYGRLCFRGLRSPGPLRAAVFASPYPANEKKRNHARSSMSFTQSGTVEMLGWHWLETRGTGSHALTIPRNAASARAQHALRSPHHYYRQPTPLLRSTKRLMAEGFRLLMYDLWLLPRGPWPSVAPS